MACRGPFEARDDLHRLEPVVLADVVDSPDELLLGAVVLGQRHRVHRGRE